MPITSTANSQQGSNTTTSVITMPASVAAGDLLIAFLGSDGPALTNTWPSPWVELCDDNVHGTTLDDAHASIGYKIATGGETSVSVTHTSERSTHIAIRIAAANWHGTTPPEITAIATGTSANPDPPSLTASWGSENNLWIACFFSDDGSPGTLPVTAWPLANTQTSNSGPTSAAHVALCAVDEVTATKDPGAFTTTGSDRWGAYTLAVRPPASAATQIRDGKRLYPQLLSH